MDVREATERDVPGLAALVDAEFDADHLLRERTVVVAEEDEEIVGFAAYDAWSGTVHVSALVGDDAIVDDLLAEPRRFAEREGMPVEIVVPDHDEDLIAAVTGAGFEQVGKGPLFDGDPSHRYRCND